MKRSTVEIKNNVLTNVIIRKAFLSVLVVLSAVSTFYLASIFFSAIYNIRESVLFKILIIITGFSLTIIFYFSFTKGFLSKKFDMKHIIFKSIFVRVNIIVVLFVLSAGSAEELTTLFESSVYTGGEFVLIGSLINVIRISMAILVLLLIAKRFVLKKRIGSLKFFLAITIPFWLSNAMFFDESFGSLSLFNDKLTFENHIYSMHKLRVCIDDNGGDDHRCANEILINENMGRIFSYSLVRGIRGKEMVFENGLLYFRQEGCCDSADTITVIDLNGKIIKNCKLYDPLHNNMDWKKSPECREDKEDKY